MVADQASFDRPKAGSDRGGGVDRWATSGGFPTVIAGAGWLDRRFGAAWSVRSLRTCLGLALIACWIAYFLCWGLGGSGRLGDVHLLANPVQPARIIGALSAIAFPVAAMLVGRALGRFERCSKLRLLRRWRRNPKQFRTRLRLHDFERRYRWLLGLFFGIALVTVLIWFRRGDVATFAIVFSWLALGPVSGIAVARRFNSPTSQSLAALFAGFGSISGAVLLILAVAGAGVSAFAFTILGITNVAFTGAIGVLLDIVMGGVFTLGLALAGAGVATVALALAGAGTGIATLTGVATMSRAGLAAFIILMSGATVATLAFEEAAVLSGAVGGISALAVAAAVSHNRMGRHGAYAGAIGAIALMIIGAVVFGWGDKPLVMFAACFFFFLPLLVGLTNWASMAAMQSLLGRLTAGGRGWPIIALAVATCWPIGGVFALILAFLLGYGAEGYNQLAFARSGRVVFDIAPMITQAARDPFGEGLWLSMIVLTPLLPATSFAANLVGDALLALQPYDYRLRRLLFRTIGTIATIGAVFAMIGFVTLSDNIDTASVFGDLATSGLDQARRFFVP